jgi:hypothetical protein
MIEYYYKKLDVVIGDDFYLIVLSIITQTPFTLTLLCKAGKLDNLKDDLESNTI